MIDAVDDRGGEDALAQALAGAAVVLADDDSIFIAALTGTCIPFALEKFDFDPSIASGPFITTMNDLTTVLVYFTIVSQFISAYLAK